MVRKDGNRRRFRRGEGRGKVIKKKIIGLWESI
jgi:hypothetical protein